MQTVLDSKLYSTCYNPAQVPSGTKRRRSPQSAAHRAQLIEGVEISIADVAHVDAGPTLKREIDEAKAASGAADRARFEHEMTARRLAQRSGVLKLLLSEASESALFFPTERVLLFVDIMLDVSANVAAFTGSAWASSSAWFRKHLPDVVEAVGERALRDGFDDHLNKARAVLSSRPILRAWDLQTGRSAKDIAHELGTTSAQLKTAGANTCQLTSVDAEDKTTRERKRAEGKRRDAGMARQAERRLQERDRELAVLADRSERTIRGHRLAGTLGSYLAQRGIEAPEAEVARNCPGVKEEPIARKCCSPKEIMCQHFQATPIAPFVLFPNPTPEEHAATMAALRAGAQAARAEWGRIMSNGDGLLVDDDEPMPFPITVAAA